MYEGKSITELQSLKVRFETAITNPRLNETNRENIRTWLGEIKTAMATPSIYEMRTGKRQPRPGTNDADRLAWAAWS